MCRAGTSQYVWANAVSQLEPNIPVVWKRPVQANFWAIVLPKGWPSHVALCGLHRGCSPLALPDLLKVCPRCALVGPHAWRGFSALSAPWQRLHCAPYADTMWVTWRWRVGIVDLWAQCQSSRTILEGADTAWLPQGCCFALCNSVKSVQTCHLCGTA